LASRMVPLQLNMDLTQPPTRPELLSHGDEHE
jgi:hypothetical protein